MTKQIQMTEEEKQRLKEGLEKHSNKYLFGSKHTRIKDGKTKEK